MGNRHSNNNLMNYPALIYIAGPYTAPHPYLVQLNADEARWWAMEICKLGGYALAPHFLTLHFEGIQNYDFYLNATLALMRRCDAVFMLPKWAQSNGARLEYDDAIRLKIPVLHTLEDVEAFVKDWGMRP